MAINKLNQTFTDGVTVINASSLNAIINKINELVDAANGSSSGGSSSGGGSETPSQNTWRDYVSAAQNVENNEFVAAYVDSNDKLIVGIRADGTSYRADIASDNTNQGYNGSTLLSAIDSMESQSRPQSSIAS